jgi:hypothetical protein
MAESPFERVSIRELVVDFLGSLVPGLIFVIAAIATFLWPLKAALQLLLSRLDPAAFDTFYANAETLLTSLRIELTLFFIMLSYVAGSMFYRQDPKKPDLKSFHTVKNSIDLTKWVARNDEDCEFPYNQFHVYLESRGLHHLVPLAPWSQPDSKGVKRTKNFVNMLKMRLLFHHSKHLGNITRNEAHIRLMSSTWYMAGQLRRVARAAVILSAITSVLAAILSWRDALQMAVPAVPALVVWYVAHWSQRTIEQFLHYQRVREVIFVLETAYIAFYDEPKLLQDICPDFRGNEVPSMMPRLPIMPAATADGRAEATV